MRLKGERFVDHFAGWGLVIARTMGLRDNLKHPCFGVHCKIRREQADMTDLRVPGPGGPVIEAPLYVDTFGLLNWNWRFWGDDCRSLMLMRNWRLLDERWTPSSNATACGILSNG